MRFMNKLEEAESKIRFADYLLQMSEPEFLPGVTKHILEAANKAVSVNFGLEGTTNVSHILINKKLAEGSKEEREFSGTYLALWKLATNPQPTKEEVTKALSRVKTFTQYVKIKRET